MSDSKAKPKTTIRVSGYELGPRLRAGIPGAPAWLPADADELDGIDVRALERAGHLTPKTKTEKADD